MANTDVLAYRYIANCVKELKYKFESALLTNKNQLNTDSNYYIYTSIPNNITFSNQTPELIGKRQHNN